MTDTPAPRPQSEVDRVAERWVDTLVELDPTAGTYIGRAEANGRLADYSPAGIEAATAAARLALAELEAAPVADDVDRITVADLGDDLRTKIALAEAGAPLRDINVIASPSQGIRDSFDLMPLQSEDDWANASSRLAAVPDAIAGYIAALREGAERGGPPAVRQVVEIAAQAAKVDRPDGFFRSLAAGAAPSVSAGLGADLRANADAASAAYGELDRFLREDLAPVARREDAVGRELYALHSREFLGATIDLDETYEWGLEELARMVAEQERAADEVLPGASVLEAIAHLDADPARKLIGTDALKRWMQETSDASIAALGGTEFDIPDELRRLECMIAPTQEGGIYYTSPTDDFSRPGRMWWSVPEGVTEFATWRELTTVYHEGVPGHHLQIGQAVVNRATLNTWRRQFGGTSGHVEGWALYAERLMEKLGFLDDPADRLGMLDGQRLRAARVVLDIGVHLGKPRPDGGGVWDAEYAHRFLAENVNMNDGFVRFELNRYLGWPGQAPAYKVGQRIWEQLRDDAAAAAGADFDIRRFHRDALALGGVGLDTLRGALAP